MEGKDNDIFGGFSAIASDLSGKIDDVDSLEGGPVGRDPYRKPPVSQDEEDDLDPTVEEEDEDDVDLDDQDDDLTQEEKDAIELAKDKKSSPKGKSKDTPTEDDDDEDGFGDAEPEMAEYLQEKIFNKFNLDTEGDGFDKFQSMDDVVNFIEEAIKVNSIPEFASNEVANIDEYVRGGGNLNDYMSKVYGGLDLNTADLNDEDIQKAIVREDLMNQGLSEARINKRIERMEDGGILYDEAEDAKESLIEFNKKKEETLLEQQKKNRVEQERANQTFVKSVEDELKAIDNIRGIKLTQAEKNKLFNYMLVPTNEGVPQYHIDYRNNRKNMIESAYFTMMGDKLVNKVETKAKSNAAKKLKDKLADKGTRGKNQSGSGSGSSDVWGMISKTLR